MKKMASKAFETLAVHAGERTPAADSTPVVAPIWPAVGYLYESMDEMDAVFEGTRSGPLYLRYGSPTVSAFEAAVAALEGAAGAQAYSSGMAAIHSTLLAAGAREGASVVAALDVYGATFAVLNRLLTTLGVKVRMVNVLDLNEVEAAVKETGAVIVLAETISNPLLKVADVPGLAGIAHRHGASLLIDNTFASPYLFNPLRHGADFVIHSATKYISGHGDVLAGVVVTSAENKLKLYELNKLVGSVLGPFEAWLAMRGLKTLPLRMKRQCENAQRVAEWLCTQPRVAKVNYPGLAEHAQHSLAERLFAGKGYGGVLSFEIEGADKAEIFRFMEALTVCLPATTLGDIYSLVLHPATSSHRTLTDEERRRVGIPNGLVRLSAGIEAVEDILGDLENALRQEF
ncbi:MAG TPA: aminotransferase class I/II-fold pyridoxal phosphate-dependent enzyme [Anaerolineales bacterium]